MIWFNPIVPDRPVRNFGVSKSVAQPSWATLNSLISWSYGKNIGEGPVGLLQRDGLHLEASSSASANVTYIAQAKINRFNELQKESLLPSVWS